VLLDLDDEGLKIHGKFESEAERKVILNALESLQKVEGQVNSKKTFWEYRSMSKHRKAIDELMPLILMAPYYAITVLHRIPEEARPSTKVGEGGSPIIEWLEFVVIPEYYFYINRADIFGGLPGFIPYQLLFTWFAKFIILIIAVLMGTVFKDIESKNGECIHSMLRKMFMGYLYTNVANGLCVTLYINVLWPFVPWAVCDAIFILWVYGLPALLLLTMKFCIWILLLNCKCKGLSN